MSDTEFEAYLSLLSKMLRLSDKQRDAISAELRDHLDHRLEELRASGMERDDAVLRALEEFGDAAGLAAELSNIRQYVRRRRIMKATLTTVSAAAAIILLTLALLPQRPGLELNPSAIAQEGAALELQASPDTKDPSEAVRKKLGKRIDIDVEQVPLVEVLGYIRDSADINMLVQWRQLERANVTYDTPITMSLKDVSTRQVLAFVLENSSEHGDEIGYAIIDGVLVINLKNNLELNTVVRFYDVSGILFPMENPSVFGGPSGYSKESMMRVADLLQTHIEQDSWQSNGGFGGSISIYGNLLVIKQTPTAHEKIAQFLDGLKQEVAKRRAEGDPWWRLEAEDENAQNTPGRRFGSEGEGFSRFGGAGETSQQAFGEGDAFEADDVEPGTRGFDAGR